MHTKKKSPTSLANRFSSKRPVVPGKKLRRLSGAKVTLRLTERFETLSALWEKQKRNMSSPNTIASHPALQQIILMGMPVVPLILKRMKQHPWFWFAALMEITGESVNPVKPPMRGDMQKMTEAWIAWGTDRGII